jgi:HEAT repeat protein
MKKFIQRSLVLAAVFAIALPLLAGKTKENEVLIGLDSPKEKVVLGALQDFEKEHPASATCMAKCKALLADNRPYVRQKAARVLGVLHAAVSPADLNNISLLLNATDKLEVMQGLKALRGLKAQSEIPKIVPLLKNPDDNIKRDSCRTLAVLGDKSLIPEIEPLLKDPDKGVVKDAKDAITALTIK